ncbi:MAG: SIR2 family protein [Desulfobacterales bacterium]|nr:SIR2 family protein [Desulfobacterales bacterium]
MPKYVKYFPKPFLDDLVEGRCVPFVGAGFSKNATIPQGKTIPLWDDLGRAFAKEIQGYDYSGAIDALSAFEHEYARPKLVEKLHELLLVESAQPGRVHSAFCRLPFDLCVTTNFEFLLERGYESVSRYCRPIIDEDQLSIDAKGPEIKLLKFHGDLHHPTRLVATEYDYDTFLDKYPLLATYLGNLLIVNTAFFIGYSLDDPDFRHIWQLIGDRLGKLRRQAYTISISASPPNIARFVRRGVKVINIPGKTSDYALILQEVFEELKEYWSDRIIETSTSSEDESLAEFSLPKRDVNRLCFFSIPSRLSAYYKAFVFPIAEKHGFAPVIAMDVISPGDSISAKVSALIDRSEIIVVDASSPNTEIELQLVLARKHSKTLVILEETTKLPSDIAGINYLLRPKGQASEKEDFLNRIDNWFYEQAEMLIGELSQEPLRLLNKKEYRASVISVMALLESKLRKVVPVQDDIFNKKYRYVTLGRLIEQAITVEMISQDEGHMIKEWMTIRNKAVHMAEDVTAKEARTLVKSVMSIINRMG